MSQTPPIPAPVSDPRSNGSAGAIPPTAADSQPGAAASPDPGPDPGRDYLGRIRANPDFAVEQVRQHQSAAAKAESELRKLHDRLGTRLAGLLDSGVSGEIVAQAIGEYQALANEPQIAQAIRTFRETGQMSLPAPKSEPVDDEYLSDGERALKTRLDALEARNHQLESQITQTTQNFGVQSLSQHLERVFTDYGLAGERAEAVRRKLTTQVGQWATQGEAGRKALADIQRPDGKDTVELLVTRALGREGLLEIAKEQLLREGKVRAGMATDGPLAFGTQGDEPPPEHKTIEDAIRAARARPEVLSRYT